MCVSTIAARSSTIKRFPEGRVSRSPSNARAAGASGHLTRASGAAQAPLDARDSEERQSAVEEPRTVPGSERRARPWDAEGEMT